MKRVVFTLAIAGGVALLMADLANAATLGLISQQRAVSATAYTSVDGIDFTPQAVEDSTSGLGLFDALVRSDDEAGGWATASQRSWISNTTIYGDLQVGVGVDGYEVGGLQPAAHSMTMLSMDFSLSSAVEYILALEAREYGGQHYAHLSLTNLDSGVSAFAFEWGDGEFNLDCHGFFGVLDNGSCSGIGRQSLAAGNYRLFAAVDAGLYGRDLGATFAMTIIPEPSATLLFGLGFMGVAVRLRQAAR